MSKTEPRCTGKNHNWNQISSGGWAGNGHKCTSHCSICGCGRDIISAWDVENGGAGELRRIVYRPLDDEAARCAQVNAELEDARIATEKREIRSIRRDRAREQFDNE